MAGKICCGQFGCSRSFTRNAEHTKHIRNHHLSRLNIQPIIQRHPLPPRRTMSCRPTSPHDMDNLDNLPYPNYDEIPMSPNHHKMPTSPNPSCLPIPMTTPLLILILIHHHPNQCLLYPLKLPMYFTQRLMVSCLHYQLICIT